MNKTTKSPSSKLIGNFFLSRIDEQRILIIGVNGFLGNYVAHQAIKFGAKVFGIDLIGTTINAVRIRNSIGCQKFEIEEIIHLDSIKLKEILLSKGINIIVHVAGYTNRKNTEKAWLESVEGNILSTANLISAISAIPENARPVLVMAGTQMEYGRSPMPWIEGLRCLPDNPYGSSKLAATELLLAAERSNILKGCVIRFPIAFGPGQSPTMIIPELICKTLNRDLIKTTKGLQQRRFIFVSDVANILLSVANAIFFDEKIPSLINSPASDPISIIDIIHKLLKYLPSPAEIQIGAIDYRPGELMKCWPDSKLGDSILNTSFVSLDESLSITVDWYINNQWFIKKLK
jgi:nucleoside-diphosphate-sugar epimerase